jgi:hypothetical protein
MTKPFAALVDTITAQCVWYYNPTSFWAAIADSKVANSKVARGESRVDGYGVFATENIKAHEVLLRYPGTFSRHPIERGYNIKCHGDYLHIDEPSELAHYINSSYHFAPNCVFVPHIRSGGERIVAVVTLRPIEKNEELLCEYFSDPSWKMEPGYAASLLPHIPQPMHFYGKGADEKTYDDVILGHQPFYGPYYIIKQKKRKFDVKRGGKKECMGVFQWVPFVSWAMLKKTANIVAISSELDVHKYLYFDGKEKHPLSSWFLVELYQVPKTWSDRAHKLGPIPARVMGEHDKVNALGARDFLQKVSVSQCEKKEEKDQDTETEPESPAPVSPVIAPHSPEIRAFVAPRQPPKVHPIFKEYFSQYEDHVNPLLVPYFRDCVKASATRSLAGINHVFMELTRNFTIIPKTE